MTFANLRKVVAQRRKRVYLFAILKSKYVKKFASPKLPKADVRAALTWGKVMARQPDRKACLIPKHSRQKKLVTEALSTVCKKGIDPTNTIVCVDADCIEKVGTHRVDVLPCLTATRGGTGECYVSTASLRPGLPAL